MHERLSAAHATLELTGGVLLEGEKCGRPEWAAADDQDVALSAASVLGCFLTGKRLGLDGVELALRDRACCPAVALPCRSPRRLHRSPPPTGRIGRTAVVAPAHGRCCARPSLDCWRSSRRRRRGTAARSRRPARAPSRSRMMSCRRKMSPMTRNSNMNHATQTKKTSIVRRRRGTDSRLRPATVTLPALSRTRTIRRVSCCKRRRMRDTVAAALTGSPRVNLPNTP